MILVRNSKMFCSFVEDNFGINFKYLNGSIFFVNNTVFISEFLTGVLNELNILVLSCLKQYS